MPAQPDTDTNAGSIVAVGLIGSILLVVVVVALEALFGPGQVALDVLAADVKTLQYSSDLEGAHA